MKRVILLAVIQAVVLFFIIGALAYAFKGDFFYNYLAVVFAPIAGVLRFGTAYTTEIVLPRKAAEIAEKRKQAKIQNKRAGELHRTLLLALIFTDLHFDF